MSVHELESAVSKLTPAQLSEFLAWLDEFRNDLWDRQIEADAAAGRLDALIQQANADFDAGRCKPL